MSVPLNQIPLPPNAPAGGQGAVPESMGNYNFLRKVMTIAEQIVTEEQFQNLHHAFLEQFFPLFNEMFMVPQAVNAYKEYCSFFEYFFFQEIRLRMAEFNSQSFLHELANPVPDHYFYTRRSTLSLMQTFVDFQSFYNMMLRYRLIRRHFLNRIQHRNLAPPHHHDIH